MKVSRRGETDRLGLRSGGRAPPYDWVKFTLPASSVSLRLLLERDPGDFLKGELFLTGDCDVGLNES